MTVLNSPPTANAGSDQTVFGGAVTLDGGGSSDVDGTVASYAWTQTAGPPVVLSSTTAQWATFAAPAVGSATQLVFSLSVTDNSGAATTSPDSVTITVEPGTTVSGRIRFERIPLRPMPGTGLDYAAMRQDPARGLRVEVIRAQPPLDAVLVTTTTDADGRYTAAVPPNAQVAVRVHAEMARAAPQPPPHWRFRVRDLDADYSYVARSSEVLTGPVGAPATQLDYDIPSGWTTAGSPAPVPTRAAAPYAILDTVYTIVGKMQQVDPAIVFPELVLDWAPSNLAGARSSYHGENGSPNRYISLTGEANVDTEEYDPAIIAHEFGHYIEERFSRADNIGFPHNLGDRLDMRVAFGEGFASAFAGIMLESPLVRDAQGPNQAQEARFNIESDPVINPGWYSELSVAHILWDLYDNVPDTNDGVALGFAPLWYVLVGPQRSTDALTSIFSFIAALKQAYPAQAAAIDTVVGAQNIVSTTMDAFGSTETNDAGAANVLPPYTVISTGGGSRTVTSTNQFGNRNKLSVYQFLVLEVTSGSTVRITVTTTAPGGEPNIRVFRRGVLTAASNRVGNEDLSLTLGALPATFILAVYDLDFATNETEPPGTVPITVTVTP